MTKSELIESLCSLKIHLSSKLEDSINIIVSLCLKRSGDRIEVRGLVVFLFTIERQGWVEIQKLAKKFS